MTMITIDHMNFELVVNYRDAFDEEQFKEKYSEVLNKYDYIVGDIGYEKLRLAGFFRDNKKKVERDKKYSAIEDYLSEYCNFGCAYFVLRKVTKAELKERELAAEDTDEKNEENVMAGTPEAEILKPDAADAEADTDNKSAAQPSEQDDVRDEDRDVQEKETDDTHETEDTATKNKTFASFKRGR